MLLYDATFYMTFCIPAPHFLGMNAWHRVSSLDMEQPNIRSTGNGFRAYACEVVLLRAKLPLRILSDWEKHTCASPLEGNCETPCCQYSPGRSISAWVL